MESPALSTRAVPALPYMHARGGVRLRSSLVISMCLCASVVSLFGCQAGAPVAQPIRAIWVTRFDYKTPQDVTRIMDNCAHAGFNTVLFQVRGNGTAFYRSSLEPWADELGGQDPGWDPVAAATREAHARHLELHAWVNVLPAWRGTKPPDNPDQLYNSRPEWFWYDQRGDRQPLSSFYVSLNPCRSDVRAYLVEVFRDLVSRYDLDGLHMDYIRFPNEPPATPRGSGLDYPRDAHTLSLYKEATGLVPDENPDTWNQWRTEQVTRLVADIHEMMTQTKPEAVLSASVGSVRENGLKHFQDGQAWIERGLIDVVFLMNYTDSPAQFAERIEPWLTAAREVPIVPGLWFGRHRDESVAEAAEAVRKQIAIAVEKTGDFCLFSYAGLFDSADETELAKQTEEQRLARQTRREILLPYITQLAGSDR